MPQDSPQMKECSAQRLLYRSGSQTNTVRMIDCLYHSIPQHPLNMQRREVKLILLRTNNLRVGSSGSLTRAHTHTHTTKQKSKQILKKISEPPPLHTSYSHKCNHPILSGSSQWNDCLYPSINSSTPQNVRGEIEYSLLPNRHNTRTHLTNRQSLLQPRVKLLERTTHTIL